jgi:hypothetical protein
MIELLVLLTFVGAGAVVWAVVKKRAPASLWKGLVAEAAPLIGGRPSAGAALDAPELRAEIDGTTVNMKFGIRDQSVATAKIEEGSERLRIYIGWDVPAIPEGLSHFPEIALPVSYTFAGEMTTRANERETAERFLERAARDLIDLRSGTGARALSLTVRGGHLELALSGMSQSTGAIETLANTTAVLVKRLSGSERSLPALPAERRCTACMDRGGEEWVTCAKCRAAYHRACFMKGAGCVVPNCGETLSEPAP